MRRFVVLGFRRELVWCVDWPLRYSEGCESWGTTNRADCGRVEDRPGRAVLTSRGVRPERLVVVWTLHCGLTREAAAQIAGVARSTGERDVRLYREGGLEALRTSGR